MSMQEDGKPRTPGQKVDGTPELSPEELADIEEGKRFLTRWRSLFNGIARDPTLTYEVGDGTYIDLKKGRISVGHTLFTWARKLGATESQIVWAVCHELSHFYDLRTDPEAMFKRYEYLEQRAADLAPRVLAKLTEVHGTLPEYVTNNVAFGSDGKRGKPYIEAWIYQLLHRHVYNALDDMYVNSTLPQRAASFAPSGDRGKEVTRLYRDYLFPTNPKKRGEPPQPHEAADFVGPDPEKAMPLSFQLCDALLRRRMVPEQTVLVSDEVRAIHEGYPDDAARQFGRTFTKSVDTVTSAGNSQARNVTWRTERIRSIVEPAWLALFLKDLERLPLPPPPEKGDRGEGGGDEEGDGEGEGEGDEGGEKEKGKAKKGKKGEKSDSGGDGGERNPWASDEDHPESIDLDVIKKFIEDKKAHERQKRDEEARAKAAKTMTPQQKQKAAEAAHDRKVCKNQEVDPKLAELYRKYEEDMKPYAAELGRVFEQLMQSIQERLVKFAVRGFVSGKFNIAHFIAKYGIDVALENEHVPDAMPQKPTTYDRKESESRLTLMPDTLRIRLVFDGSGSMAGERIVAVQQLYVLMLEALRSFEATMNLRFRLDVPIKTDVEVTMFGSAGRSRIVLPFLEGKMEGDKAAAARFAAIGGMTNGYGGTCDAEPFWQIASSVTEEEEKRIRDGRLTELLFEVTDGAQNEISREGADVLSDVPGQKEVEYQGAKVSVSYAAMQDTANAIAACEAKGIIVRRLQVGSNETLSDDEKAQFDVLTPEGKGARVAEPAAIPPAIARMLADEIRKINVKIAYQGIEVIEEDEED